MSYSNNLPSILETIILQPLIQNNSGVWFSACTGVYTNNIESCSGDTLNIIGNLNTENITGNTINGAVFYSGGTNLGDIFAAGCSNLTGGTFDGHVLTLTNSDNISVTVTGFTDFSITGITFSDNQLTIFDNAGGDISTTIDNFTGLTVNGLLFSNVISATTISATTLWGDGSNLTGLHDYFTTGATFNPTTKISTFTLNNDNTYTLDLSSLITVDSYVTAFTFTNDSVMLSQNGNGNNFTVPINVFNNLTATTISGGTFYGNGAGLSGLNLTLAILTGATFNNNILTLTNSTGSTVSTVINNFSGLTVNGTLSANTIYAGGAQITGDTYTTGLTYNSSAGVIILAKNNGSILTAGTWNYISAATLANNVLTVTPNGGTPISTTINAATGGTYSAGTITLQGSGSIGSSGSCRAICSRDDRSCVARGRLRRG